MADVPVWLQYLASISQSLGALGVLGAVVAYFLQSHGRRQQRVRELNGFLILFEDEIARNRIQFKAIRDHPDWIIEAPKSNLRYEVWLSTRARLSDPLENESQFNDFATYYGNLQVVDEVRLNERQEPSDRQRNVSLWIPQLLELTGIIDKHIREYVPYAGAGTALKTLGASLTRPAGGSGSLSSGPTAQ